jgi:hypothetical protein
MKEGHIIRDVGSPTFEVAMHFRRSGKEVLINVLMHDILSVQTGVVVNDMAS